MEGHHAGARSRRRTPRPRPPCVRTGSKPDTAAQPVERFAATVRAGCPTPPRPSASTGRRSRCGRTGCDSGRGAGRHRGFPPSGSSLPTLQVRVRRAAPRPGELSQRVQFTAGRCGNLSPGDPGATRTLCRVQNPGVCRVPARHDTLNSTVETGKRIRDPVGPLDSGVRNRGPNHSAMSHTASRSPTCATAMRPPRPTGADEDHGAAGGDARCARHGVVPLCFGPIWLHNPETVHHTPLPSGPALPQPVAARASLPGHPDSGRAPAPITRRPLLTGTVCCTSQQDGLC